MKKKLVSMLIVILLIGTSHVVQAQENNNNNTGIQGMIDELLIEGVSKEDAVYYAKLESMVQNLENSGKEILFHEAEDISDEYARTNQRELRERVLSQDEAAIKKAVLSKARLNGEADLTKIIEESVEKGTLKDEYSVKYSDGSSVSVSIDYGLNNNKVQPKVETNASPKNPGPWSHVVSNDSLNQRSVAGNYTATSTWSYVDGTSYSKVRNQLNYHWNGLDGRTSNGTVKYTSTSGAVSSYGIVSIKERNYKRNSSTSATGASTIQSYTDAVFSVSRSFSAGFQGLNISINSGGEWHQYTIIEISGNNIGYFYAAHFK